MSIASSPEKERVRSRHLPSFLPRTCMRGILSLCVLARWTTCNSSFVSCMALCGRANIFGQENSFGQKKVRTAANGCWRCLSHGASKALRKKCLHNSVRMRGWLADCWEREKKRLHSRLISYKLLYFSRKRVHSRLKPFIRINAK